MKIQSTIECIYMMVILKDYNEAEWFLSRHYSHHTTYSCICGDDGLNKPSYCAAKQVEQV